MAIKTEAGRTLNAHLDTVEHRIFSIYKDLLAAGNDITGEKIKARYLGQEERPRVLVEIYQYHNQQVAALAGKKYALGTLLRFKSALNSLEAFLGWKFNKTVISLKYLNYQFITDFEFYLKAVRGLQHNSAMGIIKKLKKIVRQCVANDWLGKDPFLNYKIKTHETHRAIKSGFATRGDYRTEGR